MLSTSVVAVHRHHVSTKARELLGSCGKPRDSIFAVERRARDLVRRGFPQRGALVPPASPLRAELALPE